MQARVQHGLTQRGTHDRDCLSTMCASPARFVAIPQPVTVTIVRGMLVGLVCLASPATRPAAPTRVQSNIWTMGQLSRYARVGLRLV